MIFPWIDRLVRRLTKSWPRFYVREEEFLRVVRSERCGQITVATDAPVIPWMNDLPSRFQLFELVLEAKGSDGKAHVCEIPMFSFDLLMSPETHAAPYNEIKVLARRKQAELQAALPEVEVVMA